MHNKIKHGQPTGNNNARNRRSASTLLSAPPDRLYLISRKQAKQQRHPTMSMQSAIKTGRPRNQAKSTHSRSYPRGVGIDFRKLAGLTLMSYIDHHGVPTRNEAPPSELAVAVARHFESMEVDEEQVIGGFLSRLSAGQELGEARVASVARAAGPGVPPGAPGGVPAAGGIASTVPPAPPAPKGCARSTAADYARNTAHFDGMAPSHAMRKRRRSKIAARPNEQVAAKVTRTDENGSWILANVQRFYTDTETYDVQDEDDTSKLIRLPWNHVMRLSMGNEGCFDRGARVMAIFPETTSFYRAVVSKTPVWKIQSGTNTPMIKELILKFEDDEDEHGRTPHRRVPSRYVIPLPQDYFYEDEDDVDLQPPGSMSP